MSRNREPHAGRAWSAMTLLSHSIEWDEWGSIQGDETVRLGLDAMASALIDLAELDVGGAPLDKVLAELGQDGELVESTARLIALVDQASYDPSGLGREGVEEAEDRRERLVEALDALLKKLQNLETAKEDSDAQS